MHPAKIHLVAAARPNFMKVAPLYHVLAKADWCTPVLVHTGQHYDIEMSDNFFRDLKLPAPDHHLKVGSGSHAEQTGGVMIAYEKLCQEHRPAWTVVAGDVNSTAACTLAAVKLGIRVAHLEAGLRSGDRTMPEEINRIVTDSIADLLWTPSEDGDENLRGEGVAEKRIERIGNIMIDSYELLRPAIEAENTCARFGFSGGDYAVLTLHRPSNVDRKEDLAAIVDELRTLAAKIPLVFPVHPRTQQRLKDFNLLAALEAAEGLHMVGPLSYLPFMGLVRQARMILTDSGGLQEETTYLGIPCLTMRENTERPITVTLGTNRLVHREKIQGMADLVLTGAWPTGTCPPLWDGHAADRAAASLSQRLSA